jgi:protoporphyrinogen oxidase
MTPRVGVLGGGISGLASALHLARRGVHVTLVEADSLLGGLGSSFEYDGVSIERYYHCMLPSDESLLALLRDVGLDKSVVWRPTSMGFMVNRQVFALDGPWDVLRFSPLSLVDRLRLGWMGIRARSGGAPDELDNVTARQWLTQLSGERVYEKLWRPLLEAKLGDKAHGIPALWLASRIVREKRSNTEVKGYIPGGYRAIVAAIADRLRQLGAEIRTKTPVESLEWSGDGVAVHGRDGSLGRFDAVVAAAPLVEFQRWTAPLGLTNGTAGGRGLPDLDYQGVVNGVFLLKKPLTKYYWMPIVESGVTCQGIVETTNLVPTERTKGLHVAYFVNYTHRTSALYGKSDGELLRVYEKDLAALFPEAAKSIEARFLFRAPFVEPIWPLRYRDVKPAAAVVPGKIYLASTAQVYPRINAWDSCCEVARATAEAFERDRREAPARAAAIQT